eukprot:1195297-Prorocentrum_minimum.AAC.1
MGELSSRVRRWRINRGLTVDSTAASSLIRSPRSTSSPLPSTPSPSDIRTVALTIHTVALNVHIAALTVCTVALNVRAVALTVRTVRAGAAAGAADPSGVHQALRPGDQAAHPQPLSQTVHERRLGGHQGCQQAGRPDRLQVV